MSVGSNESRIRVQQPDTVSEDDRVAHIDELSDPAKEGLFALVSTGIDRDRLDLTTATELVQYDVIKFTDYYCVTFA